MLYQSGDSYGELIHVSKSGLFGQFITDVVILVVGLNVLLFVMNFVIRDRKYFKLCSIVINLLLFVFVMCRVWDNKVPYIEPDSWFILLFLMPMIYTLLYSLFGVNLCDLYIAQITSYVNEYIDVKKGLGSQDFDMSNLVKMAQISQELEKCYDNPSLFRALMVTVEGAEKFKDEIHYLENNYKKNHKAFENIVKLHFNVYVFPFSWLLEISGFKTRLLCLSILCLLVSIFVFFVASKYLVLTLSYFGFIGMLLVSGNLQAVNIEMDQWNEILVSWTLGDLYKIVLNRIK